MIEQIEPWLAEVLAYFKSAHTLSGFAQASAIIFMLVGTVKVSGLSWLWDSLGKWKGWAVPLLVVAGAIVNEFAVTGQVSLPVALLALGHGVGAGAIADILDLIKKRPGLGKVPLAIIGFLEKVFRKKQNKTLSKEKL